MDTPCRYRSVACLPRSSPARDRRESGQSHSKLLAHWVHRTLPAHHRDAGQQRGGRGRRQGRQARDADPPHVGRQAPRLRARHLAPPGHSMRVPQAYVVSNVVGLITLFEAAARHADP
jgi:hypothetical protein